MRHDNPALTDVDDNVITPRTLLSTVTVSTAVPDVLLLFPPTYTRFLVEIDDWGSVDDPVDGLANFYKGVSVLGSTNDYHYHVRSAESDGASNASAQSSTATAIALNDDAAVSRFGDGAIVGAEAYSFSFQIDPGVDADHVPKIWGSGVGISSAGTVTMAGLTVFGLYMGGTADLGSGITERMDGINFSMSAGNIRRGTFRLYGTD